MVSVLTGHKQSNYTWQTRNHANYFVNNKCGNAEKPLVLILTLDFLYIQREQGYKNYRLEINIFVPLQCLASVGLLHLSLYLESQISCMVTAWSGFCVFQWENDLWLICTPCTGHLHAGWDQSLLAWATQGQRRFFVILWGWKCWVLPDTRKRRGLNFLQFLPQENVSLKSLYLWIPNVVVTVEVLKINYAHML